MKPSRPLPLHQIAAFDAAARHRSFSVAARELNVQQPAVSRQVALLEDWVGVRLFLRTKPRLTLTPAGESLAAAIGEGMLAIRNGLDALSARKRQDVVVVNVALGFASLYLLPRMGEFQVQHPDIQVEFLTRDQNMDFDPARCDIAVVFGETGLSGRECRRIFDEELVPVCVPNFLSGGPLTLEALAQSRLLHMSNPNHASDWSRYFRGTGLTVPEPKPMDRLYSYMVLLRAIQNGTGIGLGWRHMVDDMIEAGTLVVACERVIRTKRGYHCCLMPSADHKPEARVFFDWLSQGDGC
ncbi:LysR substrate-binding domain-containing protein [Ruegeria sp. XHP0148]|uniref:LysR substrate-binding domain-containing protein n=2 Tax=Ruegeria aquimaris TaxID=2984333 RepID=A0ABT3ARS0_9RHOB|nr:LysR substrate-binding domain-containing protein [Ruegeria sp. XHP0148]